MTLTSRKGLVAVALAAAGMTVGVGLASARTDPTTPPTPVAPDDGSDPQPSAPGEREKCRDDDGAGRGPAGGRGSRDVPEVTGTPLM